MKVTCRKVYYLHANKILTAVFLTGSGSVDRFK
ncbi:hypothetical protein LMT8_02700 [Leuconostoc mesenteroides subsp. cremoris TIFN8]|nr:hypothetical protein LMT8_02700 [Leuconostoc mesenteroides subsp. cremoris TIFN8]